MEPNRRKKAETSNRRKSRNEEDEKVEELLQAAQDEVLLKLSLDSHMSHVPPDYLHSDLDRRLQALKSRPSLPQSTKTSPSVASAGVEDEELKDVLGDKLSTRFAALKGSLFSSTASSSSSTNVFPVGPTSLSDDDEEDEVEKLIQWAKDAARLDPSPPSDDDDEDEDDEEEEEEEDNCEHEKGHHRK